MSLFFATSPDCHDCRKTLHVRRALESHTSSWPQLPRKAPWNWLSLCESSSPVSAPILKDVASRPDPSNSRPTARSSHYLKMAQPFTDVALPRNQANQTAHQLEAQVKETAICLLGPSSLSARPNLPGRVDPGRPPVYNILSNILSFTPHSEFWWTRLAAPFASMLQTSRYSATVQCKFLCFVHGTVIEMMPPHDTPNPDTFMTIDGSPVELSWVLPTSPLENDSLKSKPRQVRFAIEPMYSGTGRRLKGSTVLDYLTSPRGSLGLVHAAKDAMTWRTQTEKFLFPDAEGDEIPDGSRFFVGFDFLPNGTITLKAYYVPPPPAPGRDLSERSSITLWDVDYTPMRRLVSILDPTLLAPLEMLLSYFESLDDDHKPRIEILSMDCVEESKNRLKIYCRPKVGTSWSDAVRSFTLGGRLASSQMDSAVADMERLWNYLFPHATSRDDCDLTPPSGTSDDPLCDGNGIKLDEKQHPVGGLLYYYSLVADKNLVYPKIYLPVTHYCSDDLFVARAIQEYYNDPSRRSGKPGVAQDWVANEVEELFNHRSLNKRTGIHTYVTFAMKKNGTELTNYFSPEPYRR